jgi:hypothetical protein
MNENGPAKLRISFNNSVSLGALIQVLSIVIFATVGILKFDARMAKLETSQAWLRHAVCIMQAESATGSESHKDTLRSMCGATPE